MRAIHRIQVEGFLSLRRVDVELGDLNVLVGPNGAGKSNLLKVFQFLGDTARLDLGPAVERHGGMSALHFRGSKERRPKIKIEIVAAVTRYSHAGAADEYSLNFWPIGQNPKLNVLMRRESFKFKRTSGAGRRITLDGSTLHISDRGEEKQTELKLDKASAGLSTLRRLGENVGAPQWQELAQTFEGLRVFDPVVARAREPSGQATDSQLKHDASNLAAFLAWLQDEHEEVFDLLVDDLRHIVPSITALRLTPIGGSTSAVKIEIVESGLSGSTDLAYASFGTVRSLALLAMLHDPAPPRITVVEEIDHGLHPHALDRLVERMRSATRRTQLLLATHSPALVNRLRPDELIICERDHGTGASRIPAISSRTVAEIADGDDLGLGELWFSGTLGGGLD